MGYSGNLAGEFEVENEISALQDRFGDHNHSTEHLLSNDGIFTVKEMIVGGIVLSFGMTWGGACLFCGWQFGRLIYYSVRSLITLIL